MSKNRDKLPTEPYKGVRDFYPEDTALLRYLFTTWRTVTERFGYVEYKASVLEPAELYRAKGAENDEIINEQAYVFEDRGGRQVALRPEMTPTVARMVAARRRDFGYPLRLYSIPNVFRYERPQRGRLREHWQLNVDLFGSHSAEADVEIICIAHEILRAFGAKPEDFVIKVNDRAFVNESVVQKYALSNEQSAQLFRLLDRKDKMPPEEFNAGLKALGLHKELFAAHHPPQGITALLAALQALGITNAIYDPSVVRGFNYYTGMVFEVFDTHPDNNRSLFGGGRYDNLTSLFDTEPLPGVGFGLGDVTMHDFLEVRGLLPAWVPPTKLYVAVASNEFAGEAAALAQELRAQGVNTAVDFGDKKLGDQIKTAAKHHIPWLMVIGPDELASGTFGIKNLDSGTEERLSRAQLAQFFLNL